MWELVGIVTTSTRQTGVTDMTKAEFNALAAELGITIEPVRKRHTVYVGHKNVTYFENIDDALVEADRLKETGHADVRIRTSNW